MGNRQQTARATIRHVADVASGNVPDVATSNARAASARAHRLAEIERLSRADPVMWLAQHAEVKPELTEDAGVYRMKRQPPVDTLLARQSITFRQHEAAGILYRDYALGVCGARDIDIGEMPAGFRARFRIGNGDQFPIVRIDALTRFRLAIRALGHQLTRVVFPIVCEEVTVSSVAVARNENR